MIRAVLDTNVLAPGLIGRPSISTRLIEFWHSQRFEIVSSEHLLGELQRAYDDPYFRKRLTPGQSARLIAQFRRAAIVTDIIVQVSGVATQPEDDLVLATALSGGASYLATRDKQLLTLERFRGVAIVHPGDLLNILTKIERAT